MPYFVWSGVTITGEIRSGKKFASTQQELDASLFKEGIALLSAKEQKLYSFMYPIRLVLLVQFFESLAVLLSAGIRLPQALFIIAQRESNPRLQEIVFLCMQQVSAGHSLSSSFELFPSVFNVMMIETIKIGQESGALRVATLSLHSYLKEELLFIKKIRSLLMMPLITFIFLCVVAVIILGFMIPQFGSMFSLMGKDIPYVTQCMISVGNFLKSRYMAIFIALVIFTALLFLRIVSFQYGRVWYDLFILRIPFINAYVKKRFLIHFFQSLHLLIGEGVSLVIALRIIRQTTTNSFFSAGLQDVEEYLYAGNNLHDALARQSVLFPSEVLTLIAVGEESNVLSTILATLVSDYQQQLHNYLERVTTLIQPLLLLLLGIFVALLIVSVYMPIMQIAYQI